MCGFHKRIKIILCYFSFQYNPAPRLEIDTDFLLVVDDKKFTIINKVTPGPFPGIPNIDFTSTHPEGKSRLFFFLEVCCYISFI